MIEFKLGLSILDLNVCNAFSKHDELAFFINRVHSNNLISVIWLNECCLSVQRDVSSLHLPNYDMYYQVGNCPGHTPQQIIECSEDILRMLYPCYRT